MTQKTVGEDFSVQANGKNALGAKRPVTVVLAPDSRH